MKVFVATVVLAFAGLSCNPLDYRTHCGSTYVKETNPDGGVSFHTIVDNQVVECGGP